ncbi:MAG: PilZ domain-containing protein [Methylococcales bacterium]
MEKKAKKDTVIPEYGAFRWALEEFRVSLFVQHTKPLTPCLPNAWTNCGMSIWASNLNFYWIKLMSNIIEQRSAARVNVSCDLRFRSINSNKFYEASCIDLSIIGISFCCDHEFQIGEKVEVEIHPAPPIMFSTSFIIVIVRVERQENGLFNLGASIEYEQEDNQA